MSSSWMHRCWYFFTSKFIMKFQQNVPLFNRCCIDHYCSVMVFTEGGIKNGKRAKREEMCKRTHTTKRFQMQLSDRLRHTFDMSRTLLIYVNISFPSIGIFCKKIKHKKNEMKFCSICFDDGIYDLYHF